MKPTPNRAVDALIWDEEQNRKEKERNRERIPTQQHWSPLTMYRAYTKSESYRCTHVDRRKRIQTPNPTSPNHVVTSYDPHNSHGELFVSQDAELKRESKKYVYSECLRF